MFGKTVCRRARRGVRSGPRHGQARRRGRQRRRPDRRASCAIWSRRTRRSSTPTPAATSRSPRTSSCTWRSGPVFASWNAERAVLYRRQERIPQDLGTAVNVMAMVFGNLRRRTPAPAWRSPATRPPARRGVYGDYLAQRPGRGRRGRHPQHRAAAGARDLDPHSYDQLMSIMGRLETALPRPVRHRVHHRARQAVDAADPGRQAHPGRRVHHRQPSSSTRASSTWTRRCGGSPASSWPQLMFPTFDPSAAPHRSPPACRPRRARRSAGSSSTPRSAAAATEPVILVRRETNPDDLPGMIAAQGILTSRGGKTSHAAVVARGMGKTCVCGADALDIDLDRDELHRRRDRGARGRRDLHRRHHRRASTSARCRCSRPPWCATSRAADGGRATR